MSRIQTQTPVIRGGVTNLALSALITGAATIGFAPILVRLSQVGPVATAFWRLILALPVLWLWMTLEQQSTPTARRPASWPDYRRLFVAGLFFAGDMAIWHWSISFTTVANATLLVNFAPIFVTLGGWLFFRQRVSLTFVLGMAAAFMGAILLIGASFNLNVRYFWGDFLALTAAAFYAGYLLSVKYLRDTFSTGTLMAWSGVATCVSLLSVALLSGEVMLPAGLQGWLVLLGLALMIHVMGQGLIAFAMAHLPASFSSVTLLIQPVMAAVFAWLILDEALGPWQALGGVIVLTGIFVARRGSRAG